MSPAAFLAKWAVRGSGLLGLLACGLAIMLALRANAFRVTSAMPDSAPVAQASDERNAPALQGLDWSIFRGRVGASPAAGGALSQRFRLAGTFFEFSSVGQDRRMAILDDVQRGQQLMIREQEKIDDVIVLQIQRDRVLLRDGAGQEAELTLNFTGRSTAAGKEGQGSLTGDKAGGAFGGNRLAENQWNFNRTALLRYYQDLRDQPERLVKLFDSLKPVYIEGNRIQGYQLGIEGEREFFDAVGLQEGDIVHKVNNVEMTNRRRAEFFVSQFVRDESNAFVLDVERGGVTNRMVYEVR